MTDHFAEAESYLKRLDTLTAADAYVAVIAAQAHATLAQGQAAAEMVAMQKTLLASMTPQSDGAGALPTSPSPEVGVATSPPASSPIEEPAEWGSAVRAFVCGSNPQRWVRTQACGFSGWHNEHGMCVPWRKLCEPEVLPIGVGAEKASLDESVAYSNGYEKGAGDKAKAYQNGRMRGESHLRSVLVEQITDLQDRAVTSAEKYQLGLVLDAVRAEL